MCKWELGIENVRRWGDGWIGIDVVRLEGVEIVCGIDNGVYNR